MKKSEVLDALEDAYLEASAADFPDVETALQVAASALKFLTDQCDDEESS